MKLSLAARNSGVVASSHPFRRASRSSGVGGGRLVFGPAAPLVSVADAFAAFRWGELLMRHGVSAMEFPYSVAGLTEQHLKMHWPVIGEPDAPDKPGSKFRGQFGAVPVLLSLNYPALV